MPFALVNILISEYRVFHVDEEVCTIISENKSVVAGWIEQSLVLNSTFSLLKHAIKHEKTMRRVTERTNARFSKTEFSPQLQLVYYNEKSTTGRELNFIFS